MKKSISYALLLLSLSLVACTSVRPIAGWDFLGERTVNYRVERDDIRVGARDGSFRSVKLTVDRAAVNFRDLKIHFADGSVQDVAIRKTIPAGGSTRVIDLAGRNRIVTRVTFVYDTKNRARRRAVVRLYGRH